MAEVVKKIVERAEALTPEQREACVAALTIPARSDAGDAA